MRQRSSESPRGGKRIKAVKEGPELVAGQCSSELDISEAFPFGEVTGDISKREETKAEAFVLTQDEAVELVVSQEKQPSLENEENSKAPNNLLRHRAVEHLLDLFINEKQFSLTRITRGLDSYFRDRKRDEEARRMEKPSANDVKEMLNMGIFHAGRRPLGKEDQPLKPEAFAERHAKVCPLCGPMWITTKRPHLECPFFALYLCIKNGWNVQQLVNEAEITPQYTGTSKNVAAFAKGVDKEVQKMLDGKIVREVSFDERLTVSAIGCVLKNADRAKARVLCGIEIKGQEELEKVNVLFAELGLPLIKIRTTLDLRGSGLNHCTRGASFKAGSAADIFPFIQRGDFLGKTDIVKFFWNVPLAEESRKFFSFEYKGKYYIYNRCPFGFKLCPAYCDTISAEIESWIVDGGLREVAHFCDDFITTSRSEGTTWERLDYINGHIESTNLQTDKNEVSQGLDYLGLLINTVTMSLSIVPTKAKAELMLIKDSLKRLRGGKELSRSEAAHFAGVMNWYAEALPSARLHAHPFWIYAEKGQFISHLVRAEVVAAAEWFESTVEKLVNGEETDRHFRIYSASEILSDPESILLCQTDEAGLDGWGGYYGYRGDMDPRYIAVDWQQVVAGGLDVSAWTSTTKELYGLFGLLQGELADIKDKLVVWTTDSQSSFYALNKGSSRSAETRGVLKMIFAECDARKLYLVALWLPREENTLADYLSHLATQQNRWEVAGRISELGWDGQEASSR